LLLLLMALVVLLLVLLEGNVCCVRSSGKGLPIPAPRIDA
jgi:hypothetical protein